MSIYALERWEYMYQKAKEFYEQNGHLRVNWKYVTEDGQRLGSWISMLRKIRRGTVRHSVILNEDRIKRLDDIGMIWNCRGNTNDQNDQKRQLE